MTTQTPSRREAISEAQLALERAHVGQAVAEGHKLRLAADLETATQREVEATKAVDAARLKVAEAVTMPETQPAPTRAPVNADAAPQAKDDQATEDSLVVAAEPAGAMIMREPAANIGLG